MRARHSPDPRHRRLSVASPFPSLPPGTTEGTFLGVYKRKGNAIRPRYDDKDQPDISLLQTNRMVISVESRGLHDRAQIRL